MSRKPSTMARLTALGWEWPVEPPLGRPLCSTPCCHTVAWGHPAGRLPSGTGWGNGEGGSWAGGFKFQLAMWPCFCFFSCKMGILVVIPTLQDGYWGPTIDVNKGLCELGEDYYALVILLQACPRSHSSWATQLGFGPGLPVLRPEPCALLHHPPSPAQGRPADASLPSLLQPPPGDPFL